MKMKHLNMKMRKERIKDQEVQHWAIQNETSNIDKTETGENMKIGTLHGVNSKVKKDQMRNKEGEEKSSTIKREEMRERENTVSRQEIC